MKDNYQRRASKSKGLWKKYPVFILVLLLSGLLQAKAYAVTVTVVDPGDNLINDFYWTLEEDTTYPVTPGVPTIDIASLNFHKSYMPVIVSGEATTGNATIALPDPNKQYFVSILPKTGSHSMGGITVAPGQNASTLKLVLNNLPLPTAQITIFVFNDNNPINNAPDLPNEQGLAGFSILLEDAGGRYGASAGTQTQDAFGNPLGTTYNPDGTVAVMGDGIILTDENGRAIIKNLAPGKYGVQAVPPEGQGWVQTSTIEGTKVIDAWVKANEPPYFQEFGPPGYHAFIGFVQPTNDASVLTGGSTIIGQVVNQHLSRPPDYAFYNGAPLAHTTPWVGLNLGAAGEGKGVYAQRANPDGTFSIPNVPAGSYKLVIWDDALDIIFAFHTVTVPEGGGDVVLGDVPVFQWFARLENYVFNDLNENGFMDEGEVGIPEQAVNIRWRDGTIYQSFPTDLDGFVPFDQVFPFFSWLVAEVDFARFKATGITVLVDEGGPIDKNDPWTFGGQLNPQIQAKIPGKPPKPNDKPYRTEVGPVLTQAFQGFLGQTSVLMWGKKAYAPGENGGISGVVYYATTRAEADPRYAAVEVWEPGIPRVTVRLYDSTGTVLKQETTTDSWDDSLPTECQGERFVYQGVEIDCFDGLRNFNQVRPGVFDGGYAFEGLTPGEYIVEVVPPSGYEILKEEDKNVDFGEDYIPSPDLLPPVCVGEDHMIPSELSLFPGTPCDYAGQTRPLCNRKRVVLRDGENTAADFFLFTKAPVASHVFGFVLDDASNEFDPNAPTFGEKYAPPWLPISFKDWTGREVKRVYSDEFGRYNALLPSTFTANLPAPSGMSPNMLTVCLNDPVKLNPNYDPMDPTSPRYVMDPYFNRQYSQFSYTFQYMPGTTTYLDTPVLPVAAFAGPEQFPLDCELPNGTPKIYSVIGSGNIGPYVSAVGQQIAIISQGDVDVSNPLYDPNGTEAKTIQRDYGFGTSGTVTIGGVPLTIVSWSNDLITGKVSSGTTTGQLTVTRNDSGKTTVTGVTVTVGPVDYAVHHVVPSANVNATPIQDAIDMAAPNDLILVAPGNYQELVIMWKPVKLQGWGEGSVTINAVKAPAEKLLNWRQKVENLITAKSVDLLPAQELGFGGIEPATLFTEEGPGIIVLAKDVNTKRGGFGLVDGGPNARIDGLTITGADHSGGIVVNGYAHYLQISNNRIINNNGILNGGIRIGHPDMVLEAPSGLQYQSGFNDNIRIHHNQITQNGGLGGSGGGVSLCTGSDSYQVTENFICGNFTAGEGGGIGHYGLSDDGLIANNTIVFNESFNQGKTVSGGGIFIGGEPPLVGNALGPGSGSVKVVSNVIQGNAAGAGDGGGIRMSRINGQDVDNNANKNKPDNWYKVELYNNMIVNNIAALAGGGISMQDTAMSHIANNQINNNDSTATAGEAFAPGDPSESVPQPAGVVSYKHSPALAAAFGKKDAVNPFKVFSNPQLVNNIILHNRSFYFIVDDNQDPPFYGLLPDPTAPEYDDLAVLETATPDELKLNPLHCILTDPTGYDASNILPGAPDSLFVAEYYNGNRGQTVLIPETTTAIETPPAFDEGGNFIKIRFGPLTRDHDNDGNLNSNYHIKTGSAAVDNGMAIPAGVSELVNDYDGELRPSGTAVDIGADEKYGL